LCGCLLLVVVFGDGCGFVVEGFGGRRRGEGGEEDNLNKTIFRIQKRVT